MRIWIFTVLLTLWTVPAAANMRAPMNVLEGPSTALEPISDVEVLRERLDIECQPKSCRVTARYVVAAQSATSFETTFILPAETDVAVSVNGKASRSTPAPMRDVPDELQLPRRFFGDAPTLFEARIAGDFGAGKNEIVVSYDQPLTRLETSYGYGARSRFVSLFSYEIWPIRQWKRADDFVIEAAVTMASPRDSWWTRTFGTTKSLECNIGPTGTQTETRLEWSADLTELPDRLRCGYGDEDLVGPILQVQ